MRVRLVLVSVLTAVLVQSGCQSDDRAEPATAPANDPEWNAVIKDWYADGSFEQLHRCAPVQEAIERLPSRSPESQALHQDFRTLEARMC